MDCNFTVLSYQSTGQFSRIVNDYLDGADHLKTFYQHPVSMTGIKEAIRLRQEYPVDRNLLADTLEQQYALLEKNTKVIQNIALLRDDKTFTVCTAHQPALLTGPLYFIYKILHTIKLASKLNSDIPGNNFIPVFYMGSEDADLDELSKLYLNGEKIVWKTDQQGAVGRMKNDGLDSIVERLIRELGVLPFGKELECLLLDSVRKGEDIQTGIFRLLNNLFGKYGLVVLNADHPSLKSVMKGVFADDLFDHLPAKIVRKTVENLSDYYKVQANPRDINLFYLQEGMRDRIEKAGDEWRVVGSALRFDRPAVQQALDRQPAHFSPNVILRGLYQEKLLPNIAFIGGGGELAYWLELRDLFAFYKVPFPLLILRNSFLIIDKESGNLMSRLGLEASDIFKPLAELEAVVAGSLSSKKLSLEEELQELSAFYHRLEKTSAAIDPSLKKHVLALKAAALRSVSRLEKKLLRAEKRHHEASLRQLRRLKEKLFPLNSLQERIDSFLPYYAQSGPAFIDTLYKHSFTLEQQFGVLTAEG